MRKTVIVPALIFIALVEARAQQDVEAPPLPVHLSAVECDDGEDLAGEFDTELWAARLGEGDLDLRMAAYEAIVEAGARDRTVFDALQGWAVNPSRVELGWTARMALREIERAPEPENDPWGDGLEGMDWFHDSPLGRMGFSPRDFERNLQDKFEELHQQMERGFAPGAAPGTGLEQRSFRVEIGPNGVKMRTLQSDAEGGSEKQWEARSIEELLEAHPGLLDEFPGLGGLRIRFGMPPASVGRGTSDAVRGTRTDVLGIECRPLGPGEADALGLPEGLLGLLVVRTVPQTIAGELGIRRGDVLTRLNGAPLVIPIHITQALARRELHAPIKLRLYDAQGQERSVVWSPEEPGAPEPPL